MNFYQVFIGFTYFQTRISDELQNAAVMLKRVKNSGSNENFDTPSPAYRSVQDKFAGMVKRDGSMNTYRVKSQLEQQQKLQNQVIQSDLSHNDCKGVGQIPNILERYVGIILWE